MAELHQLHHARLYWRLWPHDIPPAALRRVLLGDAADGRAWLSLSGHHVAERHWRPEADLDDLFGEIAKAAGRARAGHGHRAGSGIPSEGVCARLDPQRTQALFGGGRNDWSTIEIRFFPALDEPLIQVAIGFWARPPALVPPAEEDAPRGPIDLEAFHRRCARRADRSARHADQLDPFPAPMCADGPPQFWVAAGPDMSDDSDPWPALFGSSQPSATGMPGVSRIAGAGSIYLIAWSDAGSLAAELAKLQDLEILRAVESHLLYLDLELWSSHLDVYELVAGSVGALWDAVAIRLPAFEGTYLDIVQTLMRRIHQMFSQGMADLADSASQVVRQAARAKDIAEQLELLGGSPTTPGPTVRLRRLAAHVPDDARRVTEHYKDLLQSIAHAFDERRVHGLDSSTNTGTRLAIVFGVFALVSVFDFLFDVKHHVNGLPQWTIIIIVLCLVAAAACFAVYLLWRWRWVTWSTKRWFTQQYPDLVPYHYASSTETLRQRPATETVLWGRADDELVEQFARLWREAIKHHPNPGEKSADVEKWKAKKDIKQLTARIESRMIMLLLLAERPPRLHRYQLPRLTLLLRYIAWLPTPEDFLPGVGLTVVSFAELQMALLRIGFTEDKIRRLDLDLKKQIDNGRVATVDDLVKRINQNLAS